MNPNITPQIEHLYRIEKFLETISDLDRLLEAIIRESASALNAESSSLALYDADNNELYFFVVRGSSEERAFEHTLKSVRLKMGTGIAGWCAARREPVIIPRAYDDPRFDATSDQKTGFTTRNIIAIPMIHKEKLVGVVEAVNSRRAEGFNRDDEKILSVLAAQAALVIENARLYRENIRQAKIAAMGQGIAGAAHCIKNILAGIGSGEFVVETGLKHGKMEKVQQGWDVLKRNTKIMKELVLDMLAYSKEREPEKEPSDINGICTDIADLMREKAAENSVSIRTRLSDDIGKIHLDPKGIYRCLLNLVSNAVDACDKDAGEVTIATDLVDSGRLTVSVKDNGCGISAPDLEKLFTVFFSTKGSKGTGLGLSVTQKIVEEHGGAIDVTSEVGAGTTFTVRLPAVRE